MSIQLKPGIMSAHCQEHQISRDELSRRMRVSTSTAYRIEHGEVSPSPKFIAAFLQVTGKSFEELFDVDEADDQQVSA